MIMLTEPVPRIFPPKTDLCANSTQTDLASFERAHILQVLHDTGWRIRADDAARRPSRRSETEHARAPRREKLGLSRPGRAHPQHEGCDSRQAAHPSTRTHKHPSTSVSWIPQGFGGIPSYPGRKTEA